MLIYTASDFIGSFGKVMFEVRKQLMQMYIKEAPLSSIGHATALCWFPLMLRDVSFRSIMLASYYATCDITHEPQLKYSMPEILEFMRQRRADPNAPKENFTDLSHLFYEFHNYEIKTSV